MNAFLLKKSQGLIKLLSTFVGADGIPSTKLEEYLYSAMDICDSGVEGGVGFKEVMKEWLTTSLMTITDLALLNEAPTLPKDKVIIDSAKLNSPLIIQLSFAY